MTDVLGTSPTIFYSIEQARLYNASSAFRKIQTEMTLDALELANFTKGSLILDLGCGTGFSTVVLLDKEYKAIGCDVSTNMLEYAKAKKLDVVCADVLNLPFLDNTFDGAISISTMQWLKPDEYELALSELSRVLKPKSTVIIQFYPSNKEEFELFILKAKNKRFSSEVYEVGAGRKKKTYIKLKKRD